MVIAIGDRSQIKSKNKKNKNVLQNLVVINIIINYNNIRL